ncbi:MAG: S16 family serine protease [Verrucomicrobiota bacterium]
MIFQLGNCNGDFFEFSFGDKYSPKDGGSAGTAFCILMESLVQGFEIDQNLSVTGDITIDGKIREVGGIPFKLDGSIADGCQITLIPQGNEEQVIDFMIIEGLHALMNTQIFSVKTLDEAIEIAKINRDEDLAQSIDAFSTLAKRFSRVRVKERLKTDYEAQKMLIEIIKKHPHHLSSKFLIQAINGTIRRKLTLNSSIEQILNATGPFLYAVVDGFEVNNGIIYARQYSEETYRTAIDKLNKASAIIDPQVSRLSRTLYEMVYNWRKFDESPNKTIERKYGRLLVELRDKAMNDLKTFSYDEQLLKDMIQKTNKESRSHF